MAKLRLSAPSVTAVVLALVTAGLLVTLVGFIRPARAEHTANRASGAAAFTEDEQRAMAAAKVELVNLLTYSRKSFDADYKRALAGTTGQLHSDLADGEANTKKKLDEGKFDLKAEVTNTAVAGSDDHGGINVLLVANGYRVDDSGTRSIAVPNRIKLTMTKVDGKWLAADLQGVYLE